MERLASLQRESESDKTGAEDSNGEAAAIDKLMQNLKATRVTAEEAEKLNGLGKKLEGVQEEPNLSAASGQPNAALTKPASGGSPPARNAVRTGNRVRRPIRPPNR